jgi:hypothetical protein
MINVAISAIWYPMTIASYYLAALRRRSDVNVTIVGPSTGAWIPWVKRAGDPGMTLPDKYVITPDLSLPMGKNMPIGMVESRLDTQPDLWLQIHAGYWLIGKPKHGVNVIVGTDPHVLAGEYALPRQQADRFYSMQAHYMKPGDHYLPYAFDPVWHQPEPETERTHDVTLLGLHYENRTKLVARLRQSGVNVLFDLGLAYDEARHAYAGGPIGLNWSSLDDLTARVFELLGMHRLAIVNHVPDLPKFFADGVDLVTFRTLDEAADKVLYYLTHPAEGQKIADIGHRTVQEHTWDARIDQVLRDAGLV